jgi:hypothetical protein
VFRGLRQSQGFWFFLRGAAFALISWSSSLALAQTWNADTNGGWNVNGTVEKFFSLERMTG